MSDIPNFPGPRAGSVSPQTSRARARNLPVDLARSLRGQSRNRDVRAAEHVINGRAKVLGVGEATVTVKFPVRFIQVPTFTYGGELAEGSALTPTNFPTISGIVSRWEIADPDQDLFGQSMRIWYTGATIAIVTTGPTGTDHYLHWSFSGKAITNPMTGSVVVPPNTG